MIGSTISHYKILEKLGEGGMGVVYKAQDSKLNRTVALKFLPANISVNEEAKARFLQEARAASALNHPHVCTIYGIEEYEGPAFAGAPAGKHQFIEMEFVDGATLRERLKKNPFSILEVVTFAIQIGEALAEAHTIGIVHRDIKSDNILVNSKNQIKVMDFGLAKLKGGVGLTKTATTVGTIGYMSPEQIQSREVDHRSDIWSLGVVIFEMLTGRLPFRGEHEAAMVYSIANEEPQSIHSFRNDVPEELESIVAKALEKDVNRRYQGIQEMMADLESARSSTATPASHHRRRAWLPRRKRGALVAGVVTLVAAGVISGILLLKSDTQGVDSIAILPFENVNGNPDVEYLSDGITENLINRLSRISSLRVVPRSTVFTFKGKSVDPQAIGEQLKVRAVLTGRVLQRGDNLNVQTDLIDVTRHAELWGEQYNEKMTDLLVVQEQIVQKISEKLELHLTGEERNRLTKRYTENMEAYQLYLKGDFYIRKGNPDDLEKGLSLFNQASELDPNFALPYVGIAYYYAVQTDFTYAPHVAMPEIEKAVTKALTIDPELADAMALDGFYELWYAWNWTAADKKNREALRLNPNHYLPHFVYSWYYLSQGDTVKALAEGKRMIELEPLSPEQNAIFGQVLYYVHRYDEAFDFLQKSFDLAKDHPITYLVLSWCYLKEQNFPEAIAAAKQFYDFFPVPWTRARLAYVYARAGERSKALALLDTLREESKRLYVPSDVIASVYTALGDKNRAFEYLDKGFKERAAWMIWLKLDPIWDPLRSDSRFSALLKRMNLEK